MKLTSIVAAFLISAAAASAQLITTFADTTGWGSSIGAGASVNGSLATLVGGSTDSFLYVFADPVTIPTGDNMVLTAQFNPGNASSSVSVQFLGLDLDSNVVFLNSYTFAPTTSMTALAVPYGAPFGQPAVGFLVGGDGAFAFNVTLDALTVTAIPEPSQVALGLGAVALLGAVYLRRRKA